MSGIVPTDNSHRSVEEQVIDDDDRQARFWRRRPDGFAVNEKEHVIYALEFKRVTDNGEKYVEQLSFVAGHKSVSASA